MIANVVQNPARSSLSDTGFRSWSEEIQEVLDERYPQWKEPQKTTMVPPVLPYKNDPGHLAEKKAFDLLKLMGETKKEPMFVIHSHHFSELPDGVGAGIANKWIKGEHDIVVLHHKYGLIFMQVKAGKTFKEYAKAHEQLQKDKLATAACLKKHFGSGKLRRQSAKALFDYPGFVVMPNCPKAMSFGKTGIFKEDCESVEAFMSWWDTNVKMDTPTEGFTQEIYEHLAERFVGCPEKVPFQSERIDETCDKLDFVTREQWKVMRQTQSEQWITGPAGSGKTWLLQEKVVELARQSLIRDNETKILVLCYHRPLAQHLENQFQIRLENHLAQKASTESVSSMIHVMTYEKFVNLYLGSTKNLDDYNKKELILKHYATLKMGSAPKCSYQHIFVDEGQDLYGIVWPNILKHYLQKCEDDDESLEPHYFWVMFDSSQTVQPTADNFRHFTKYLRGASKLTRVLRNTGNIFNVSQRYYDSELCPEIELGHGVAGPEVTFDDSLPDGSEKIRLNRGSVIVAQHIQELQKERVQPKDICVLTTEVATRDNLSKELLERGLECQNAEVHIATGQQRVIVESIRRFKGLESKCVILFDPTTTKTRGQLKELLYSALTRCFCLLVIVSTKSGCELIRHYATEKQWTPSRKRQLKEESEATEGKRPVFQ